MKIPVSCDRKNDKQSANDSGCHAARGLRNLGSVTQTPVLVALVAGLCRRAAARLTRTRQLLAVITEERANQERRMAVISQQRGDLKA